jgi:hypothetical protein
MKKILYTMFAILGFANFTTAQLPSFFPTNGLVAFYPFNGNANDASGMGNNGINSGAILSTDRKGNSNSAYSFNGSNSYISFNVKNLPLKNSSRTISLWFLLNPTSGYSDGYSLISYGSKNKNGGLNDIFIKSNPALIEFNSHNYYTDNNSGTINSLSNSWHHLLIRYDSTSIDSLFIFLDNTKIATTNHNINNINKLFTDSSLMFIGKSIVTYASNFYFNGKIDDIGIWNRALTQQEISLLYTGCLDTISTQPSNLSGVKGSNKIFSFTHSGTGNSYQWQSNAAELGWQNVPNATPYVGANTNSLTVNNLSVSNHNQLFRVVTSKTGCADTSNIVKLTVSDVANDSISLKNANDSISKLNVLYANKHDTLYIGSSITSDTLRIAIRTGISSASPLINSLKVYPNPAATLLYIDLEKPGYFIAKLSSITGQTIITPTSGTIDVSSLANGVYILTIYDSNNKLISTNKVAIVR